MSASTQGGWEEGEGGRGLGIHFKGVCGIQPLILKWLCHCQIIISIISTCRNNVVILNSTYTRDSPPPFRPITDYVNTTPKKIDLGRTVSRDNRLRDRYSDNTLPKKEKANGRFEMVREPLYDHLKVRRAPK